MHIDFAGKVVVITGGALGIGRGAALEFAQSGAQVAIADLNRAAGEETLATLQEIAPGSIFIEADISTAEACRHIVDRTVDALGGIDILFNNVGIQPLDSYANVENTTEAMWDRIQNINLKSYFLMSKYAIPHIRARGGGVILNTASVQGIQSMQGVPAYAASKGGVLSLTRNMALDYARENIRVLAICPGTIETEMVRVAAQAGGDERAVIEGWERNQPLGRLGQPADIGKAAVFLASEHAGFMTGEAICVDGGVMAMGAWSSPPSEWA